MTRIANNKYLVTARDGVVAAIPFLIVGSFFLIVAFPPVPAWDTAIAPYRDLFLVPFRMTLGLMSVYIAFSVGHAHAKHYKLNQLNGGLLSLLAFMMLAAPNMKGGTLPDDFLGGTGIFTAIIGGILVVELARFLRDRKIGIKLPDSVPEGIANAFDALIPVTVVIVVTWLISVVGGLSVPKLVLLAFKPLAIATDSVFGPVIFSFFELALWSVGIHGSAAMGAVFDPILLGFMDANAKALASGQVLPHIFTPPFQSFYLWIGGSGATMALVLMSLRSRAPHMRQISRLALLPGLFNINEPIVFGAPIVYNPLMILPYILAQVINGFLAYIATAAGLVAKAYVMPPWTTPAPIGAYLATGDWKAPVLVLALIVLDMGIYYPFLRSYENRLLEGQIAG